MWINPRLNTVGKKKETARGPQGGRLRRFLGGQKASMTVEFALLAPVFILLVFGIIDFGHAWYMKMEITSASREGARYGTRYQGPGKIPNTLSPSISSWVTTNYGPLLPADANLTVTPGGTGYTSGTAGDDLTVTVTATKTWFVIGNLIPGLGSSITMSSTTAMKCE
jgi:Flp pilus assembly protein TadG